MKKIIGLIVCLFISSLLFSQNNKDMTFDEIPDEIIGSWFIEQTGEGRVPSQIFRWKFSKTGSDIGECEFHWLFKRQEDKDFIAVAVLISDLRVKGDMLYTTTRKVGSMQIEPGKLEFYDEIKWYVKGDSRFEMCSSHGSSLFEIKDGLLIMREDHNKDGDFDDEGESQSYIKEVRSDQYF